MQVPLKLLGPPNPRQRAIGTIASQPAPSSISASSLFFSNVGSNVVSASVIAHAFEQFEPKMPSLNLLSLKSGLPASRKASRLLMFVSGEQGKMGAGNLRVSHSMNAA